MYEGKKLPEKRHYDYDDEPEKNYPGDKCYKSPEYSEGFHKIGSTRAVVNFGQNYKPEKITETALISTLPNVIPDINLSVTMNEKMRILRDKKADKALDIEIQKERFEVEKLEVWRQAPPLKSPNFEAISKKYGAASIGYVRRSSDTGLTKNK